MAATHSHIDAQTSRRPHFCLSLVFAAAAFAASCAALAEEPISAVLKAREVGFTYRSSSALFPCHELQSRVAMILRGIGARDDLKVSATDCDRFLMPADASFDRSDPFNRSDPYARGGAFDRSDPFDRTDRFSNRRRDREQMAHVRIWLMTPVPVTPQVLKEMDKDKSRRELISRVTGNPVAAMNDPIVFAATRQPVTLSRRTMQLEPEDCELLEQMSRSIFRELDVRVVRGSRMCHGNTSLIAPEVTVEALLPVGFQLGPPPKESSQPSTPAPAGTSPAAESDENE